MAVELTGNITNATSEEAAYVKTNARIDNIIANGTPTEGNTELIDIRTGADNVTYQTAGTAVRSQITNLSDRIDSVQTAGTAVRSQITNLSDRIDSVQTAGTAVRSQITNLSDRIDSVQTELIDIRTGADGTVYASAGAAVRGQATFAIEELNEIKSIAYIDNYNLFDKTYSHLEPSVNQNYQNGWLHGYYDYGSGLNPYEGRYTTYFIPVVGGKTVYTKINDPQECRTVQFIHAYDINKNRLVSSSPWVGELSLPINTRFIKITTNQLSTVNNKYFTVSYEGIEGGSYKPYEPPHYNFPDESARQMAVQNCSDISDLKTAINTSDSDILPDYWKTYLDTKIGVLREKLFSLGNHGVSFMFFTDYHLTENQRHTKAIMKYIANKTKISKIIFGGDILGTHTINEAKNLLWDFVTKDSIDGQINLLGNHDINLYGGTGNTLTLSETYSIYGKEIENICNTNQNFYFFQDNESQKIRYIYLNTEGKADGTSFKFNEDTAQAQWFCDTLASTPDNYKILVFCHLLFNPNADTSASLTVTSGSYFIVTLMEDYNARQNGTYYNCTWDFRNSKAECMALICGHVHRDYSVNSSGNIRIISTVCDANSASANAYNDLERTTGTYKEQAIDIFFVDTKNNAIETIRIGAGEDRSFSLSSYQQDTP